MRQNDFLKILVFPVILFLALNIVLLALKIISEVLFWAIIILGAVFAYKILPKVKK